ncbi:dihydroorotate dehydrogenase electron transfer subunit [Lentibacillus amyloliquefaciens]|uniref:Dihydrdoorotate oxidase n=1 Tax=Lentibacillus amyloliquefaciens TaxID=1472767 RepID=A0A0U4EB04_9BACI|nr:dihydroorotate dehydrogenase electron transfer subunit [Lentibacillus amyloliquefaciens]ALX47737.1 dihydrdoorotate oxidase [Lentibacillus amyloliquefaciens]
MKATSNLKVLSNKQLSRRYWHMAMDSSSIDEKIEPGQFFNIQSADNGSYTPLLRRPFSTFRINENSLEFLYKVEGPGTAKLSEYTPGDYINLLGPQGVPFSIKEGTDKILLLGRGVGIATLAALAQKAFNQGIQVYAVLSARSHDDLLAAEALKDYCTEVVHVTEEEQTSGVDNVREIMNNLITFYQIDAAYTCGSRRLSVLLQNIIKERNIDGEVALEEYMACGVGVCYSCVCDVVRNNTVYSVKSCEEGPVFPIDEVVFA